MKRLLAMAGREAIKAILRRWPRLHAYYRGGPAAPASQMPPRPPTPNSIKAKAERALAEARTRPGDPFFAGRAALATEIITLFAQRRIMTKEKILAALRRVTFAEADLARAQASMDRTGETVSKIDKEGLCIGLTPNKFGDRIYAVFAEGFFLGELHAAGNGRYALDALQIPVWLLDAIGTPLEDEARRASLDWSVSRMLDDAHFAMLDVDGELSELRRRIEIAGKINQ